MKQPIKLALRSDSLVKFLASNPIAGAEYVSPIIMFGPTMMAVWGRISD